MTTQHHKTKLFTYWRARFTPEPFGKTMQALLEKALKGTTVGDRRIQFRPEAPYFHFLNYKTLRKGYFCASFFGYEKGRIGQMIEERLEEDHIEPSALPPQTAEDGTERQYLDGKLFFICFKNHLILAQDQHTKGRQLEKYFGAIIRARYPHFPEKQHFTLERAISEKAKKSIKGVKKIHLSSGLEYSAKKRQGKGEDKIETARIPVGPAWEALQAFLKDKLDLKEFTTKGFIDPKEIDVTISLAWKKKRRGERISDQLDALANTFRHVDDELDIELETHSGRMKKEQLRLEERKSVLHRDDMPDLNDIFDKMADWHQHLVSTRDI